MARTVLATVATTTPSLALFFDGDPVTHVPAVPLAGYSPTVGDRVRAELRTPLPPIVLGKVSS